MGNLLGQVVCWSSSPDSTNSSSDNLTNQLHRRREGGEERLGEKLAEGIERSITFPPSSAAIAIGMLRTHDEDDETATRTFCSKKLL